MNNLGIIVVATGVYAGRGSYASSGSSLAKDEEAVKKWLNRLTDAFKKLAWKIVHALRAILRSVADAICSFTYMDVHSYFCMT